MVIKWTYSAEKDLEIIYKFYLKTSNKKVANKIINEIVTATDSLNLGLYLGQIEPLLSNYSEGYRYLISNHTKIIYTINEDYILITHVFDTRRRPTKLKKR